MCGDLTMTKIPKENSRQTVVCISSPGLTPGLLLPVCGLCFMVFVTVCDGMLMLFTHN